MLKVQLRFRITVLQQSYDADKDIYKFLTKQKGQLNSAALKENLLKLLNVAANQHHSDTGSDSPSESNVHLVGKHIDHQFTEDKKLVTYSGKVASTVPGFPEWFNVVYNNQT